jgi:hypothetical protein
VSKSNDEDKPSKYSSDLFTSYMNSWYEYVNTWSNLYAEFIRNTSKMNENWLDSFSALWSGLYKDKIKVE